ncbi:DUF333 domain-containing protein [Pectobacteriaceae bacterium CE90]|nr:DUF333 domain-containing protein [Pectobacteriaceae bacterium CE90]
MKLSQWFLASTALILVACSSNENIETSSANLPMMSARDMVALQNDGSSVAVICTLAGGKMGISRQLNGTRIGTCLLNNGKRCDEQELMSGTCSAG